MGSSTLFAGRCCHLCRRTAAGQCGDPAFSQHGRFPAVHDPAGALYRTGRPAAGNHRHGKCVPDSAGLRQYLGLFEKGNSLLTETLHKATHDAPPFPQLSYLPKNKKIDHGLSFFLSSKHGYSIACNLFRLLFQTKFPKKIPQDLGTFRLQ